MFIVLSYILESTVNKLTKLLYTKLHEFTNNAVVFFICIIMAFLNFSLMSPAKGVLQIIRNIKYIPLWFITDEGMFISKNLN
jgi:hypothetical protein